MTGFGSGSATFSTDEEWLIIDNLTTGCELYQFPQTTPVESFSVPRSRSYVHEAIFLQHDELIACGDDYGRIHIFYTETAKKVQTLQHGSRKLMVQVLSVCLRTSFSFTELMTDSQGCTTQGRHLLASGTDGPTPLICVWTKKVCG